jgi:asparagine synthase (glutamine-hydrolysing)
MCGIAGLWGIDLSTEQSEQICRSMLQALHHRGPDASGIFHDHPGRAHLAHARLSIIDLSERANQPLHRHGRYSIVFNGEIYNYQTLRQELEKDGISFLTQSDTEVLLALYEKHGSAAFQKLRGMYALAIWDRQEKRGVLARDPFGIKPLYYAQKNQGLLFASEIKALLASGLIQAQLSPEGVSSYLRWGSHDPDQGLLQNIKSILPGTYLELNGDHLNTQAFPSISWDSTPPAAAVSDFRSALLDSVAAHLVSDVPVGLFLSGGLDSSSLLAACHILGYSNIRSFTLSFPNKKEDESSITQKIASHFDCPLISQDPSTLDLPTLFSDYLNQQDLPSIDGFNTYCVSRIAASHGIKVVLSGLGGDELLGGYPSFQRIIPWIKLGKCFSLLPGNRLLTQALPHFSKLSNLSQPKLARLSEFLTGPPTLFHAYRTNRCLFTQEEIHSILNQLDLAVPTSEPAPPAPTFLQKSSFSLTDISHLEATRYMKNQLLRDSDACSMAHGIELRVPFVDVPLWNLARHLPEPLRYEKGKALLHRALPELPPWLFQLPKRGFSLPYQEWRQQTLADFFQSSSLTHLPYQPTWYQEMALLSLRSWRQNIGL